MAAGALMAGAITPTSAQAAIRDCPSSTQVRGALSAGATILDVDGMRCTAALRVVRRHGRTASGTVLGDPGSGFWLGRWSCTGYQRSHEQARARCTRGKRAFRVEYGS